MEIVVLLIIAAGVFVVAKKLLSSQRTLASPRMRGETPTPRVGTLVSGEVRAVEPHPGTLMKTHAPFPSVMKQDLFVSNQRPTDQDYGGQFDITYIDSDGVVTNRTIRAEKIEMLYDFVYVSGYCSSRRAYLTLRADRISSAKSLASGEMIRSPAQFFAAMAAHLAITEPQHASVMSRAKGGLEALIWISQSDREITTDEFAILFDFIDERNRLSGTKFFNHQWSRAHATSYISDARPTLQSALGALAKMRQGGPEIELVRASAKKLALLSGPSAEKRRGQLFR